MLKKLSLFLRTSHLKRAIAKDLGEDRGREVGDDREQDRHPSCGEDEGHNVEGVDDFVKLNALNKCFCWHHFTQPAKLVGKGQHKDDDKGD